MTAVLNFPRGSVIQFSNGEYSDYGTCGLLVTVIDLDLPALAKRYRDQFKPEWDGERPELTAFPSWLIAQGLCMPVDHSEVHLGSYGSWVMELGGDDV